MSSIEYNKTLLMPHSAVMNGPEDSMPRCPLCPSDTLSNLPEVNAVMAAVTDTNEGVFNGEFLSGTMHKMLFRHSPSPFAHVAYARYFLKHATGIIHCT
jgi:hypothetical protein